MRLQTMSNIDRVSEELSVGRSDPAYMAHAYLTKVPAPAIAPFIEAYSPEGGVVVDPFAGSGMTGVAALMSGRAARLFDISVLGKHIGENFVNLVDGEALASTANHVVAATQTELGNVYGVSCAKCSQPGTLAKAVWSVVVECSSCHKAVNFYRSLEAADWRKPSMVCGNCGAGVSARNVHVGEEQVLDSISSACSSRLIDQDPSPALAQVDLDGIEYPHVEIGPEREMYKSSALGKSGRTTIASFYSDRNLAVLATLRKHIGEIDDEKVKSKLLFAFTACLTRASKRYQWSRQRPLNAANANYYVAPVFYEWNVYELFLRKVAAVRKSDEYVIRGRDRALRESAMRDHSVDSPRVTYETGSAEHIALEDASADYVFTDPPFGSNLFYADMALFQEAWLDGFTDVTREAVVDRSKRGVRTSDRYEGLLTMALAECDRILKPGGYVSMVFGNSSGKMWGLIQRAIANAGLVIEPDKLVVLDKGQRSVKGLASGFEHVATLDLIITMRAGADAKPAELVSVSHETVVARTLELAEVAPATPSHLYLEILRAGIREGWKLDSLDLRDVTPALLSNGWELDSKTGRLSRSEDVVAA
jgi:16S rRNA G966 N2-methylase RsmD